MIDNQSIAVHVSTMHMLISLSVDVIMLPRYVNKSTNFRGWPFNVKMVPSYLKHMNSVLSVFV